MAKAYQMNEVETVLALGAIDQAIISCERHINGSKTPPAVKEAYQYQKNQLQALRLKLS